MTGESRRHHPLLLQQLDIKDSTTTDGPVHDERLDFSSLSLSTYLSVSLFSLVSAPAIERLTVCTGKNLSPSRNLTIAFTNLERDKDFLTNGRARWNWMSISQSPAMEFSIRQRLLTWQLICCPLFLLARKHNQSSFNRETNLLSPPLTNSRNFDTSRRWTPNQTIDRCNERKRGYAGQVWLSVDIMTGSVFIIFDVGWGGGLLLFLCVWRVAEQTHTHTYRDVNVHDRRLPNNRKKEKIFTKR
jgi:hypothetical protein